MTSDRLFAFVVCLDHTLKVWNLDSHALVASKDLLNRTSEQQDASRTMLNPAESAFIRIFNAERATENDMYYAVTYSPHDDGQFKFWAVRRVLTAGLMIDDMFPNAKLKPVDPDDTGNVFWNVVDFQVRPAEEGRGMALWVLWRSNTLYQLDSLHFDLQNLDAVWDNNWTTTALELRTDESPPDFLPGDVVDPSEKWLDYLFSPGRYTPEVLGTSLAIYQDVIKYKQSPRLGEKPKSLKQRVSSTIIDSVSLRKFPDAQMDFERHSRDLDARWRQFWHIAQDINKRRNEAISLAYDTYSDVPWLILADGSALIRECSGTELLLHNEGRPIRESRRAIENCWPHRNLATELGEKPEELCRLLAVAASFRQSLAPELHQTCRVAFNAELFVDPSLSAPERLAAFHGRCGFADVMSDDVFDSAYANVDRAIGLKKLCNDQFFAVVDTLPLGFPGKDSNLLSTDVGRNATVRGAMETIWLSRQIIRDLTLLAVFVESEVAVEERTRFDGVEVFATLIDLLREYEMMNWLGSNVRAWPESSRPETPTANSTTNGTVKESDDRRVSTILEDLFAVHIKPRPAVGTSQMYALTQQIRDVTSWITRQGEVTLPNVLVFIQCNLLACGNIDLASDFMPFQPNTAWSTYVKGRLYVTKSEFDIAAIYFQKAAYVLCKLGAVSSRPLLYYLLTLRVLAHGKAVGNLHEMSSNLVDLISVNNFYNGLPKYFQHIVGVFEQARAFTHVSDFSRLALQALESSPKKSEDYVSARTDLLSRLFHASLKTCRFDEAYSALSRYSDPALQKSALTSLITTILTASGSGNAGLQRILRFPLSLTGDLSSHVDDVLASLAKKQLHTPSLLSQAVPISGWQDPETVPDYNHVLQAYRIARKDFRGAAEVAYQTVCRIRKARDEPAKKGSGRKIDRALDVDEEDDLESRELRNELLALINLIACMEKNEAYILVEQQQQRGGLEGEPEKPRGSMSSQNDDAVAEGGDSADPFRDTAHSAASPSQSIRASPTRPTTAATPDRRHSTSTNRRDSISSVNATGGGSGGGGGGDGTKFPKRVVITLDDLRREYQAELDRVSRIQRGDWEFGVMRTHETDREGDENHDLDMDMSADEDGSASDGDIMMGAE